MKHRSSRHVLAAVAAALSLAVAACGATPAQVAGDAAAAPEGFPLTVTNCGAQVTFDAPPERVVLLSSSAVPFLADLGLLDKVVARAGAYPAAYYDQETQEALDAIPLLTDALDSSGHLQISKETVLAQKPDLVLGEAENLTRETLGAAGIPLLDEPAMCPEGVTDPSFDDVAEQMTAYARVFGVPEAGARAAEAANDRVAAVRAAIADAPRRETRTAAVLYPTVGGGTTYAYGAHSMAQPQLEAAGLENVFGDVQERVFEVSLEELIGRDPDVLVLLHSDGDPAAVKKAVTSMNGADTLTAVSEDEILVQLFNFTEPPTPLSIDGLEKIVEHFGR
ncbi:ABC transporter substrate-binding protein [Mumia quercus]|uniref:ABC transporter substrate-binding protein n=1 Tax=Mumia quercus TaxID=2976125 RepID=UPI0021CE4844|nr:ABC transporter substrate-binding protein [Mumia quercus]